MFINDVNKKEEIRNIALQYLRKYGIKYRPKKPRSTVQVSKYGKKLFKVPLQNLETETVTLKDGQQLILPKRIHEMCSFILTKAHTEGIFRKEGSKSRQNVIKLSLDRGCLLGDEHHVIDVAVVLKSFLRDLPEPLVPYSFHELFLRCSLVEEKLEALYLSCLLLPTEHLNVLSYLIQFFSEIAGYSEYNKMNFSNLSIVIGPNIFPFDEKVVPKNTLVLTRICDITKLMMENSRLIGVIPEYIIEQIGNLGEPKDEDKRRKKRRSGSLTRMLMGLKKIVSSKPEEDTTFSTNIVTPDLLLTPSINRSVKKKKAENGFSSKKKKDLVNKLPECALLNTPFTPSRTPISVNSKKKTATPHVEQETENHEVNKDKKTHWYMRSRSMKTLKDDENRRSSFAPKSMLERRWSAVSQATNFRRKNRNSCVSPPAKKDQKTEDSAPQPDYVRVSKMEYEEIKSRVSAIERRISLELEGVKSQSDEAIDGSSNTLPPADKPANINCVQNVQTAYEKTLVQAIPLSPTTDQLARRLSRDLKIRRSAEQKVIRSPSARKIGSLRRRSREVERRAGQLVRNQSWHVGVTEIPRVSLRRKKKFLVERNVNLKVGNSQKVEAPKPLSDPDLIQRSNSFQVTTATLPNSDSKLYQTETSITTGSISELSQNSQLSCNKSGSSSEPWVSAEGFFNSLHTPQNSEGNTRASIAKLRSQNAGMVLAKARLFDKIHDSDNSSCSSANSLRSSNKSSGGKRPTFRTEEHKIGATRNVDSRMSYRVRSLRSEERKSRKNCSPRRRMMSNTLFHKQRISLARQYVKKNKENSDKSDRNDSLVTPLRDLRGLSVTGDSPCTNTPTTMRNMPQMKKSLTVKSPKRLCRTPVGMDRRLMTPLKALNTPKLAAVESHWKICWFRTRHFL